MAYDLIGDLHGCREELTALLTKLGYAVGAGSTQEVKAPEGRSVIFLGDLVNRGPDIPGTLRLVMGMLASGCATCVAGNHDVALAGALQGLPVEKVDALSESLRQLEGESAEFKQDVVGFVAAMPRRLTLDGGQLIVAHAGLPEEYHDAESEEADDFAVNGRRVKGPDGKTVRYRWAEHYRGAALVVYGHYAQPEAAWLNHTICLDTGCVYGGRLTALRYPELELVSVPAARVYYDTPRSEEYRAVARAGGA
jgi:predicted phosphodiesterase